MSYPEFERDCYAIYQSEVMGEALFATAARLSRNATHKRKWRTLCLLESQTRKKYLEYVAMKPRYPLGSRLLGYLFGAVFALVPWPVAMNLLASGTPPLLSRFKRLLENATTNDTAFFRYVLEHEQAIDRFAKAEQQQRSDSLLGVIKLLESQRVE